MSPRHGRLHIVHCIDTEGPLTETIDATFQRIEHAFGLKLPADRDTLTKLQNGQLELDGLEAAVGRMVAPDLLAYNMNWDDIRSMLDELLSSEFRCRMVDDEGNGWVYSWHCLDHMFGGGNPRQKELGYGKVFRFYRAALADTSSARDELNWHFHPLSLTGDPLHSSTSYTNSYPVLNEILCRRVLEDEWFPVVNRPGYHTERPDSHAFLEQWIPFDYANQSYEELEDQPDTGRGRFGDWRRASRSWRGYRPSHDDYQLPGSCRRTVFRCLNIGTRLRTLRLEHVRQAFGEAQEHGSAILAFSNHDYRDIRTDVTAVRSMIAAVRPEFPNVAIRFSGAEAAARDVLAAADDPSPHLSLALVDNRLMVTLNQGEIFGPQPFLAVKARDGRVFHDNLDVQEPGRLWTYVLDEHSVPFSFVAAAGVGTAGRHGGYHVARIDISST